MPDSPRDIPIEKLRLKKEYDESASKIDYDEFVDLTRMEETIRVARQAFKSKALAEFTLLKSRLDKETDPKIKAAIQNEIQRTQKQSDIDLQGFEGIWKRDFSELKQSYTQKKKDLLNWYNQALLALAIREKDLEEAEKKKKKEVSPGLLITRTQFPKWWKDLRVSGITIVGSGVQTIVQGGSNFSVFIASITVLTTDATSVSFGFGSMGASGPMPLGDTDQPKGMTISMSDSPAPCGQGGFTVNSIGGTGTLGGFVVYYVEKMETQG